MLMPKKIIVIALGVFILAFAFSAKQLIQPSSQAHKSLETHQELIQKSLMRMLYPYIQQALTHYYGHSKSFMNDEILEISDYGPFDIKIKIRVTTFEGPHNPPYGTDVITLILSDKVEILDFSHQNEVLSEQS